MKTVEVVIRLPKDLYKGIECRNGELETEYVCDELMKAIDNGTVLPKGHGRLIDTDKLGLTDFEIVMCDGDYKKGLKMLCEKIENAPTILDAEVQG